MAPWVLTRSRHSSPGGTSSLAGFYFSCCGFGPGSTRWLGTLILVCALNAAHPGVMGALGLLSPSGQLFEPIQFLLPPLLAAYASALRGQPWHLRPTHLLHLVPFAGAVIVTAVFTAHGPAAAVVSVTFWGSLTVQMAAYLVPALRWFHHYRASLTDRVSNLDLVEVGWLRWFFSVAAGLCLLSVVVLVLLHTLAPLALEPWVSGTMTVAVWVLGLRGLLQKDPGPPLAADRPSLSPAEAKKLGTHIARTFETTKPHLDPDLDLAALASLVGAPRNHVSYAINNELGVNFYDLVNGWRLKEFRALAADPARDGDKILTLAFDAGFNAKPTFNKVLLKLTGKTPSQVRAEQIESRRSR